MHLINQPTTSRLVQATFLFPEADRCTFNYYQPRKLLFAFISATTTTTSSPRFRVPDVIRLIYTPGDTLSRPHSDPVILFGSSRAKETKKKITKLTPPPMNEASQKTLNETVSLMTFLFHFRPHHHQHLALCRCMPKFTLSTISLVVVQHPAKRLLTPHRWSHPIALVFFCH